MKTILILLLALISSYTLEAQDITGEWNGLLDVQGSQLRIVFHVTNSEDAYSSTMDSPDQNAFGIPVTNTTFENGVISFKILSLGVEYDGKLKENEVVGLFKQSGQEFPMNLSREVVKKEKLKRPQEPIKPYPYYSEDVTFYNKDFDISLSGTLTLPKKEGVFPVVILISGSGPQNRDEELFDHKPFLVISDHLTKNGIGVLRYDDRGVGKSEGTFNGATSIDFASDVASAIEYLKNRKEVNKKQIGLIGHSEGGLIAPMIASRSNDVAYMILLAGPGIQGDQILLLQQKLIGEVMGVSNDILMESDTVNRKAFEIVKNSTTIEQLELELSIYLKQTVKDSPTISVPDGKTEEEFIQNQVKQVTDPWMQFFIKYDPAPALEKVTCPVLALNGEKDLQVPSKVNLEAIERALTKGGNKDVTVKEFPNLNHLFQKSEVGSPAEYSKIEETFSLIVLEEITSWIKLQTN